MRRSLSSRIFAAFFAPWFAIVVAEPVPLHDCPEHSLHPAAAHAGMEHPGAAQEHSHATEKHGAPGNAAHRHCCCLGTSCATALAPLDRAPQLAWVPAEQRREAPPVFAASFTPASAEHFLPFANGPPATRV